LWNNSSFIPKVLIKEDKAIHLLIYGNLIQKISKISIICALVQEGPKQAFWDHLHKLNSVIDLSWYLIRDFNEMDSFADKVKGSTLV